MIAQCKSRTLNSITDAGLRDHVQQHVHLSDVDLVVGRSYHVFGVFFRDGVPWYLMCEEIDDDYPTPHCSAFFDLVDARLPEGWVLSFGSSNLGGTALLPSKWAEDGHFLERLVEGDAAAIAVFEELKVQYGVESQP